MPTTPIPLTYPTIPTSEPISRLQAVRSETTSGLAEAQNQLRNRQCRFATWKACVHDHDVAAYHDGNVLAQDPGSAGGTVIVDWKSSPDVEYVVLVLCVQQGTGKGSGGNITAELQDDTGTGLDDAGGPGIQWDYALGDLPINIGTVIYAPSGSAVLQLIWEPFIVTTGWTVDDDPGTAPTRPRPLIVPSADAGIELQVELVATNIRILWVEVWERLAESVET